VSNNPPYLYADGTPGKYDANGKPIPQPPHANPPYLYYDGTPGKYDANGNKIPPPPPVAVSFSAVSNNPPYLYADGTPGKYDANGKPIPQALKLHAIPEEPHGDPRSQFIT